MMVFKSKISGSTPPMFLHKDGKILELMISKQALLNFLSDFLPIIQFMKEWGIILNQMDNLLLFIDKDAELLPMKMVKKIHKRD